MSQIDVHPSEPSVKSSADRRFAAYAALAAVPCVAGTAAVADTYDGSGNTPVTASSVQQTWAEETVFVAAGLRFKAFAFNSVWNGDRFASAAFGLETSDRSSGGGLGRSMKFFLGGSAARTVSASAAADFSAFFAGYANDNQVNDYTGATRRFDVGTGHLGFSVLNSVTGDTVNGFIEYTVTLGTGYTSFTVSNWAYNIDGAITMPANGGGGAVPGLGGLAALACGAAGVRRNRNRVA